MTIFRVLKRLKVALYMKDVGVQELAGGAVTLARCVATGHRYR